MQRKALVQYLDEYLKPGSIKDFCPNGLQVEGSEKITKVVTGVTASQDLIDAAIQSGADTILVHHGYFWKGEPQPVTGMKKARLKRLLENDMNLLAYHLPLDIHPEVGNNVQLAKLLNMNVTRGLEAYNPQSVALVGELQRPMKANEFARLIEVKLGRKPLVSQVSDELIKTISWCTGGGQSFIDAAAVQGIDAFLSGEASEQTIHTSREMGVHFFAAGHHATERYGVKALGEHLAKQFELDVQFIDIDNPV
ncbi:Nif3-like dinuclear metal center hexameric protein [Algicola sagamiensis]|uniref:Nif3-like dinuclear metal center hexameric protein n=1 Tax=Algicola sagamiensis TaxID=163869 RepID=UPI000367F037|nr:Nif3-like dinuclear metal center hexameric protein [Algicola sagamiensis]